jgi:hypothetical protein
VLHVACCVTRVVCCVLRVECCVLRGACWLTPRSSSTTKAYRRRTSSSGSTSARTTYPAPKTLPTRSPTWLRLMSCSRPGTSTITTWRWSESESRHSTLLSARGTSTLDTVHLSDCELGGIGGTRLIYFACRSRNSVLLNNDGDWVVEEAVKAPRCIPGLPGPVRYHGIDGWDEHGAPLPKDSTDYQQWLGECRTPWRSMLRHLLRHLLRPLSRPRRCLHAGRIAERWLENRTKLIRPAQSNHGMRSWL